MSISRKSIKSRDGKIEVKYDEVENVCICVVIYALLLYLLLHKLETIKKHTIYIFDESVAQNIRSKLPSVFIRTGYPHTLKYKIYRKFIRLYTALTRNIKHPYIKNANIYAQDGTFPAMLIGKNKYALLTDGPLFFTTNANEGSAYLEKFVKKSKSFVGKLEKLIYGTPFVANFGNNTQCSKIYLTEENESPLLKGKNVEIVSLKKLWNESEYDKKQFILNLFNISPKDIDLLNSYSIYFFSNPIVVDNILSKNEYFEILNKIFSKYDQSKMIIKTHPRDTFNYQKYFPQIAVFNKPVNIQLLSLFDISIEKAITIYSSSVYELPENVKLDWFGPDIHPNIKKYTGDNCIPPRPYNQMSL